MIWVEYLLFFSASFGISWLISPMLPGLLERRGILDHKSLPVRRPTAGGIAIIIPFLVVLGVVAFFNPLSMNSLPRPLIGLFFSCSLIAALGFYDDTRGASPIAKLAVQAVAGLILVAAGIEMGPLTNPLSQQVPLGMAGNLVLILWVLVITNSVNLIDGIDGLASGISLISAITLFTIAHFFGENTLSALSITLAGALFGFIRFNLPPAKIFLGDTGSLFLGFVLAAISVMERRKGSVTVTLLLPIVILAIPVIDAILAFFRRVGRGQNPMNGDREHLHHRLVRLGLSDTQVNMMMYLFCIYLGVTAGVLAFMPKETAMVVLVLLGLGILIGMEILRTVERGK